ncbi:MAG: hypothetical protein AAF371_13015 [Pseudomonadota bacterium]
MKMNYYLVRCDYHASAWHELMEQPNDVDTTRLHPVTALAERLGGRFASVSDGNGDDDGPVIGKWVAFGSADLIAIVQFPDDRCARAFSIAISAERGVKNVEITPMLHFNDAIEVMNLARKHRPGYSAPGK